MRNWITIVVIFALLVAGGVLLSRVEGGGPLTLTRGYVPQLDSTQALLLAGAAGFLIISTLGMGATLAVIALLGSRQLAQTQPEAAPARRGRVEKAPAKEQVEVKPEPHARDYGPWLKMVAVAANVLVVAFVVVVSINHFVLNPPAEGEAPPLSPPPGAQPTVPPPPPAAGPGDLQAAFAALPPGDAAQGEKDFQAQPCHTCHSLTPDQVIVGPSLAGVATRAATRKPGYSAELYLYESITNPSAYVVDGFPDGVMPKTFAQQLTPQQLADIIAFLMTQK